MTDLVHSGSGSIPGGDEAAGATMLQKAVAAVNDCEREKGDAFDISDAMALKIVRAVLMAIREPNEDVRKKLEFGGYCTGFSYGGDEHSFDYVSKDDVAEFSRDLIDAILADG